MVIIWFMMVNNVLVGGIPTPLKNDGVKVSWEYEIPNIWKKIQMFQTTNQLQYETGWFGGSPILGHTHIPGTILFWAATGHFLWFQGNIYIAPPKNGNVKSNSNAAKLLRSVFGGWYVLLGSEPNLKNLSQLG